MFTGEWIRNDRDSPGRKVLGMVAAGIVLLVLGLLWNEVFPINKKMWTSSFVLVVGAYSVLIFALFYYLIDVCGWRRWTLFFTVIGMNSITVYLAQSFISFWGTSDKIFGGLIRLLPENSHTFFVNLAYIIVVWLVLYFLYRKRVFLKV